MLKKWERALLGHPITLTLDIGVHWGNGGLGSETSARELGERALSKMLKRRAAQWGSFRKKDQNCWVVGDLCTEEGFNRKREL